jgi:ferrochelatase
LYPQFSLAATESSIQKCIQVAKKKLPSKRLKFVESFYDFDPFVKAFAAIIQKSLKDFSHDHVLFSFHGLPERQIKKTDLTGTHCLNQKGCCEEIISANQNCYRAQCFATARLIAQVLNIPQSQYTVCFQSRLGKTPWIQPFTDQFYRELPKKGVKRLAVVCPAFVADCLETLEEVQMRGRDEFILNGGEDLKLVPSLNSSEEWVKAIVKLAENPELASCRRMH